MRERAKIKAGERNSGPKFSGGCMLVSWNVGGPQSISLCRQTRTLGCPGRQGLVQGRVGLSGRALAESPDSNLIIVFLHSDTVTRAQNIGR